MRSIAAVSLLAAVAYGQATFNQATGQYTCAIPNGDYCAGSSLGTNIIIRCTNGVGQPGNCNDNLAGVPPVGVKTSALCYQTSNVAGDAACSFNGIAYPDNGKSFPIPGSSATGSSSTSTPCTTTTVSSTSTSCSTSTTLVTSSSTPCTTTASTYSSVYTPPPYQTLNSTVTISVGPTGTGGSTGTGSGYHTGTSATWSSGTPTPTPFTGAGNQVFVSSSMALLPVVGFLAYFL